MIFERKFSNNVKPVRITANAGFTLIEILITIVVLSVGLLAVAAMHIGAINANSTANCLTESLNVAQSRLEEIMSLQYSSDYSDPDLTGDLTIAGRLEPFDDLDEIEGYTMGDSFTDWNGNGVRDNASGEESYTDTNANGIWDFGESYVDSNNNGVWDAAHVAPNPPPGYIITWSVIDDRPVESTKFIRIFVTQQKKTVLLTCTKYMG